MKKVWSILAVLSMSLTALQAVETTNAITFKGKAGLNDSR